MIGIKDQIAEYPAQQSSIENKIFKLEDDENFYLIIGDTFDERGINKMNTLLKDDEIFGARINKPTIFTYIIGTQIKYIEKSNILVRDIDTEPTNHIYNLNDTHIWAKLALSTQEINSKHNNMLYDSNINFITMQNSIIKGKKIDETVLFTGAIDRIYYAGELIINTNKEVTINFMSGTFMIDVIETTNPPQETIDCIKMFFKYIGASSVEIDVLGKTFINKKMTRDLLDDYIINANLQVGIFEDINDAKKYQFKKLNLARLQTQIYAQTRSRFKNEAKISELKQEYEDLQNNTFNMK